MSTLYFAYGSNMSPTTMRERVGVATSAGSAWLRNHRLAFTLPSQRWTGHAADILPAPGGGVWGVLWDLPDAAALDPFEQRYNRVEFDLLRFNGDPIRGIPSRVFTYTVKPEHRADREAPPATAYLDRMIDGAQAGDLPGDYVAFLRSCSPAEIWERPPTAPPRPAGFDTI